MADQHRNQTLGHAAMIGNQFEAGFTLKPGQFAHFERRHRPAARRPVSNTVPRLAALRGRDVTNVHLDNPTARLPRCLPATRFPAHPEGLDPMVPDPEPGLPPPCRPGSGW
jgi:hypothetical protein